MEERSDCICKLRAFSDLLGGKSSNFGLLDQYLGAKTFVFYLIVYDKNQMSFATLESDSLQLIT